MKPIEIKKMNQKGGFSDLFLLIAIAFIVVLFFGAWIYGFDILANELMSIDTPIMGNPNNSVGNVSEPIIGHVNEVQKQSLPILAFVMIFFLGLSIPITNFIQKSHPVFFAIYIFIVILAFIMAVEVSNAYEDLLSREPLAATLQTFTASNFIMLNLPIWISIIGILGGIFLFAGILRDAGMGGTIAA